MGVVEAWLRRPDQDVRAPHVAARSHLRRAGFAGASALGFFVLAGASSVLGANEPNRTLYIAVFLLFAGVCGLEARFEVLRAQLARERWQRLNPQALPEP